MGYRGSLSPDHPHYLMRWHDFDLAMNLIDPPTPLFQLRSFEHFLNFTHANCELRQRPLLIHCNRGELRTLSLALLYLAKEAATVPQTSYDAADRPSGRSRCCVGSAPT